MNNDLIGLKFYDAQMNIMEVLEYSERFKGYLLSKNGVLNGLYDIEQESTIQFYLSKQEKYIECHNKHIEAERIEKQQQEAKEKEYNNTYGYADNMSPMAKGKVLKILNATENYFSNGEFVGIIARKDFLKNILDAGGNIEHKTNLKYWNKPKQDYIIKANEYRLCLTDLTFYEITKTEFDYATYIINNNLQKAV